VRQGRTNWLVPVRLVELLHSEKVACGKAAHSRLRPGDVGRQSRHHAISPLRGSDLAADVLANLPIEVDQRRVDCMESPFACGGDELKYLRERSLVVYRWPETACLDLDGKVIPFVLPS
jgi:hypothetical protein